MAHPVEPTRQVKDQHTCNHILKHQECNTYRESCLTVPLCIYKLWRVSVSDHKRCSILIPHNSVNSLDILLIVTLADYYVQTRWLRYCGLIPSRSKRFLMVVQSVKLTLGTASFPFHQYHGLFPRCWDKELATNPPLAMPSWYLEGQLSPCRPVHLVQCETCVIILRTQTAVLSVQKSTTTTATWCLGSGHLQSTKTHKTFNPQTQQHCYWCIQTLKDFKKVSPGCLLWKFLLKIHDGTNTTRHSETTQTTDSFTKGLHWM